MIIIRTPYRISFFGGSTDYPDYYREHGGSVISTTINKYSFLVMRKLPEIFDYNYRTRYYEVQETQTIEEINNSVIRETMRFMGVKSKIDITHHGDLPSRTGIGSSSSFTVSLLHGLNVLGNRLRTKRQLALDALHLEQNVLCQSVGSQDQVAAAFGGFNRIDFGGHQEFTVNPLTLSQKVHDELESCVQLFFTDDYRDSETSARKTIDIIPSKYHELSALKQLTDEAQKTLFNKNDSAVRDFAMLLNEEWRIKKSLHDGISNPRLDEIYSRAIKSGAIGGKLLGAGGGGFMLFVTPVDRQAEVEKNLGLKKVDVNFEYLGSQVIYYDNQDQEL